MGTDESTPFLDPHMSQDSTVQTPLILRGLLTSYIRILCSHSYDKSVIAQLQGDSGGPLMCYHDSHWVQVGIVSFGYQCGDVRYPGIYTNVNYFYDWMSTVMSEDNYNGTTIL